MTTDKLKAAAEAAKAATAAYIADPTDRETGRQWDRACAEFSLACTEDAILALIRERDEARERAKRFEKLDCEAATHVESVIAMRTGFTGDPPYVGWKGLGLALTEALDKRDAAEAALSAAQEEVGRVRKQVTSTALDALAADGQAHESYAAAMALYERLTAILDWFDLATDQPGTFNGQGVKLLQGPAFDAARNALTEYAVYAPKDPTDG